MTTSHDRMDQAGAFDADGPSLTFTRMPTKHGVFSMASFPSETPEMPHVVLTLGDMDGAESVLTRVHSECLTGEVFGSRRCDCGPQLEAAMAMIAEAGRGLIVYLRQEGRGIGLANKLRAYKLQDGGLDTLEANLRLGLPADQRDFGPAADIIETLRIRSIRLMTNNPDKLEGLRAAGIAVEARVPLITEVNDENRQYLMTKSERMNHQL